MPSGCTPLARRPGCHCQQPPDLRRRVRKRPRKVHLSDSLSNPGAPLLRLVAVVKELGSPENAQTSSVTRETIVAQSGVGDPALVRLEVRENRKLSPSEVAELVDAYRRGTEIRKLARQYGVHRHTVDRHLERADVVKRPVVKMSAVAARARELYEEGWSTQRIGRQIGVSASTAYKALKREGVKMRAQVAQRRNQPAL